MSLMPKATYAYSQNIPGILLIATPLIFFLPFYFYEISSKAGEEVEKAGWIRQDLTNVIDADIRAEVKLIDDMYVYSEPNLESNEIAVVRKGYKTKVIDKVINEDGPWYKVRVIIREPYYSPRNYGEQIEEAREKYLELLAKI